MNRSRVRLLLSDVDGTLVTSEQVLSEPSIRAVEKLGDAGILFAVTSGRPPRGLSMLVNPLQLATPLAAFNGGLVVDRDMKVLQERTIPEELVAPIVDVLNANEMSIWIYQGTDWFVLDTNGPHVQHNSRAVQFAPTELANFNQVQKDVVKIVGVSDDPKIMLAANEAVNDHFGDRVSATCSSTYYLDVTHRDANKGHVVHYLADAFNIGLSDIATIGDMSNDLLMFAAAGLSIAMGNATDDVKRAADHVSLTNDNDGFAFAVDQFILNSA